MPNWIPAREARELLAQYYRQSVEYDDAVSSFRLAEAAILHRLEHGHLASTARRMSILDGDGKWSVERADHEDTPISTEFWGILTGCSADERSLDWVSGDFSFTLGPSNRWRECVHAEFAFGVAFDRDLLPLEGAPNAGAVRGGRLPKWNWLEAVNAIWSQLYSGDLKPTSQAVIEKALISYLSSGDAEPSESAVRPYARMIWREAKPEGENSLD